MQEEREREKAAKQADESPEAELNLISDDEIEAMRREAEEEERNERKAEVSLDVQPSYGRFFIASPSMGCGRHLEYSCNAFSSPLCKNDFKLPCLVPFCSSCPASPLMT